MGIQTRLSFNGRQTAHKQDYIDTLFCSCGLVLDSMNLINEYDLDILKSYLHTKNDLSRSRLSQVGSTQTETGATENITTPWVITVSPEHLHLLMSVSNADSLSSLETLESSLKNIQCTVKCHWSNELWVNR